MGNRSFPARWGLLIAVLVSIAASAAIYFDILYSPFQFDDFFYVADNQSLRDMAYFWPPKGTRYLGYLSFALNLKLFGPGVLSLHLTNIVIHIINGVLAYLLVELTFRTPVMRGMWAKDKSSMGPALALATALLFIVHPVQTESVTYISQRLASLAATFYLLSAVLFIKWRLKAGEDSKAGPVYYILALLSAIAAQKTKEISFTLPAMLLLYEFAFFTAPKGVTLSRRLLALLPFILTMVIIPLELFGPDAGLFERDSITEMVRKDQMKDLAMMSRRDFFITELTVVVRYLGLLVLPINQNADYDVPLLHSPFDPRVVGSAVFLLAIAAGAVYLFARGKKRREAHLILIASGIFWFFITISVESSIIPIKDIMVEHRLYLPGIGASLAFSSAFFYLFDYLKQKARFSIQAPALGLAAAFILAAPLGSAAYLRNTLWKDTITICEDVAKKSPNKASAHYLLANAYYDRNMMDEAIGEFTRVLVLNPTDAFTHYKLWSAYSSQGKTNEAMIHYYAFKQLMSQKYSR